jgi:hypothetical protein
MAALNFILVAHASGSAYLNINLNNATLCADLARIGHGGTRTRTDSVSRHVGAVAANQGAQK